MSERGVFAVDRGIWDHDVLSGSEPFSRREAWLWLLSEAAWRPHKRRIVGRPIQLRRGQYAGSLRFIASKWRWTEPRVRRFLASLISAEMIDAKTDAGVTVLTICKYDEYQRVSLPTDAREETDVDAGATQERRKVEDKEYKEQHDGGCRRATRDLISDEAKALDVEFAVLAGHDPAFVPPAWPGAANRIDMMLKQGVSAQTMRTAVEKATKRKRDGPAESFAYFERPIMREHAMQSAPLPKVVVTDAEVVHVERNGRTAAQSPVMAALDRLHSDVRTSGRD
jgi:hypothetical protein